MANVNATLICPNCGHRAHEVMPTACPISPEVDADPAAQLASLWRWHAPSYDIQVVSTTH